MKKILALALFFSTVNGFSQGNQGFEIKVKLTDYKADKLFLGNYFGDKEYLKDSSVKDSKGWFVFKGNEPLPCGIYSIINDEKNARVVEFIVSSEYQKFTMETSFENAARDMKIKGSPDNVLFSDYQKYMINNGVKRQELGKYYLDLKNRNADSAAIIKKQLDAMDGDYEAYRDNLIKNNPTTLTARLIKSLIEIEVPDPPVLEDGSIDSSFQFKYYKEHYWDNIDFTEDCMVRTPFFHKKLETYMTKMVLQYPDSIIVEADRLVAKSRGKKELYHYVVWWITMNYERSKYMCMESVPVHMWKNYYQWPDAFWVDTTTMTRIREREKVLEPLCCEKVAPNLIMNDMNNKPQNMHKIKAKRTVLVFWDPDCSHCKKEMPILKDMYDSLKSYGLEIYAVGVEQEYDKWKKYILEKNLDFINVIDIYNQTNFRYTYDINSTPVIFLLDEDKKILGKKMGANQLYEILLREFEIIDKNTPLPVPPAEEENPH